MFVKIIKNYRDIEMNQVLVPKTVILEVTEERANKLIEAGVAEEFVFAIPETNITENIISVQKILEEDEVKIATKFEQGPEKKEENKIKNVVKEKNN